MVGSGNPDKEGLREDLEDHDAEKKEKTEAVVEEEETRVLLPPSPLQASELCQTNPRPSKERG